MFRFTGKPSSGSHSQCLTKITHLVQSGYVELVQDVSVMAALHMPHRSQYAAITLTTSCTSSTYPLLTKCVNLVKYWLWLPDDGFLVNRNMLENFFFLNFLITLYFF